jgi:hypothetical protein
MWRQVILPSLGLFASTGTLLCCALPALLVTLGLGASLAGFISVFPWITAVSEYKISVFIIAGIMLIFAAFMQWKNRNAPCPADARLAKACMRMRRVSKWILLFAIFVYLVGAFFAFAAVHIFY